MLILLAGAGLLPTLGFPAAAAPPRLLTQAIGTPLGIRLSGSQRARVEFLNDQTNPAFRRDEDLLSFRTVLRAEAGGGPITGVVEIWDSRTYTARTGTAIGTGEVNTLEPVQAYVGVDLGDALGTGSRLQLTAGRMMLNLGSRRLVAADDYRNTTNGYTGIKADLSLGKDFSAVLIGVLPQQRRPDDRASLNANRPAFDREGFDLGLWGGLGFWHPGPDRIEGGFFRLAESDRPGRPTRDRHLDTIDLRLVRDPAPGRIDHDVEAAWQWGEVRANLLANAPVQRVRAGFVRAAFGYTAATPMHPRLGVEFDYASGDRPGGDYTRFDTLFGMRRADYSPGSIFAVIGRTNLLAPAVRFNLEPTPATDGHVSVRGLWAANRFDTFSTSGVRDPIGMSGRFAGYEIDSRWRHWLKKGVLRAEWNGTLLLRQGLLRDAPNAPAGPTTFYTSLALLTNF